MPFRTNADLPNDLQEILPAHAQDIYRETFNSAYDQYVKTDGQDEGHAHAVAWSAVKKQYQKNEQSGKWHRVQK